jgi:hypothetical protein
MLIKSDRIIRFFELVLRTKIQAIAIFPFIVLRESVVPTPTLLNHERIHLRQQRELLIIPFFVWYLIEAAFKDYKKISFEREAYVNEKNGEYLKKRKPFAFLRVR